MPQKKRTKLNKKKISTPKKKVIKGRGNLASKKNYKKEKIWKINLHGEAGPTDKFFGNLISKSLEFGRGKTIAQFAEILSVPVKPVLLNKPSLVPPAPPCPVKKPEEKKIFNKTVFYSVFAGLVLAGVFTSILYVFAVPPDSKYGFGATLDPNCTPGSTNCSVVDPAQYSFTTNNFSGTGTFTTTGIGTFGNLQTGANGADGQLTIYSEQGGTDYSLIFQPNSAMSESTTYVWPTAKPSSSKVLQSDSSGNLTWETAAGVPGGSDTQVQYNSSSAFAGSANLTFDGTSLTAAGLIGPLKVSATTGVNLTASNGTLTMAGLGDGFDENLTFDFNTTTNQVAIGTGTGVVTLNFNALALTTTGAGTFGNLQTGANGADGQLTIYSEQGDTDYSLIFQPNAAMTESSTYVWPAASATGLLKNTSGTLSWDTTSYTTSGDLAIYVPTTRTISATSPLAGGGNLSADRTLTVGGLSSIGTGNYVVGVNSGATAWEYKNIVGVASETDITHGANSITIGLVDPLALSKGGTAAALTANTGGIVYSGASALAILAGTATANQVLLSGATAAPAWSTATYPATTTANYVLYSTATNTVGENSNLTFNGTTLSAAQMSTDSLGTGITLSGASGVLTVAGVGNTNNENLTVDFEGVANTVGVGTGTGVTKVDFADTISLEASFVNIITETSGYRVDGLRALSVKGSTGSENLFLGQSGNFTTTGTNNILAGYQAGLAVTDGDYNVFIGDQSGYSNTTGLNNTFYGAKSGYSNISGSGDVFLGYQAGYYETGSNKLFIDNAQRASEADARTKALMYGVFDAAVANQSLTVNGKIVAISGVSIGADAANNLIDDASGGTGSTTLYIGNSSINVTAPSDISVKENIVDTAYGINNLMKFSIKDFKYKKDYVDEGEEQEAHTGMIAQEVEEIYPEAVIYRSDGLKAIDYTKIIPLIIKSIQDLKNNNFTGKGSLGEGNIQGVEDNSVAANVKSGLVSLGAYIEKGVATFEELFAQKAFIKTARIQKLEMVDSTTGEIYCTWIENGNWQKTKGECESVKVSDALPTQQPQPSADEIVQQAVQQVKEEVAQKTEQAVQEVVQQAQQAANNALETTQNAQQAVDEKVQEVVQQAAETASKEAKEAVKEIKEEIKQEVKEEVKQELQDEKSQNPNLNGQNEENIEQPVEEAPAQEPAPQIELPPVGEMIQDAASSLLDGMRQFIEFLFKLGNLGVKKAASLDIISAINKTSAGLLQIFQEFIKTIKVSLEETTPSIIRTQTANVLDPLQNFWQTIIVLFK